MSQITDSQIPVKLFRWSTQEPILSPDEYQSAGEWTNLNSPTGQIIINVEDNVAWYAGETEIVRIATGLDYKLFLGESSTGLISFSGISFTTSATTFSVGEIHAFFVDNTNPNNPTYKFKIFPATSGNTLPNLASQNVTYVAIDVDGVLHLSPNHKTAEEHRTLIPLGVVVHSNRQYINVVNNQPVTNLNIGSQLSDLKDSLGFFNIEGNIISANGANLFINKSSGKIFKEGINFVTNSKSPDILTLAGLTAPTTIRYRTQTGIEQPMTNSIDVGYWDNNGTRTALLPNKYTIQHIYIFQSNLIRIQYGQTVYGSLSEALQNLSEPFVVEDNIKENGLLLCLLVVKSNATVLNDDETKFIEAPKFGGTIAGSFSTTSLQQAYENSITPEITTNSTLGAFTLKNGQTGTTNVFEILNSGDAIKYNINSEGVSTGTTSYVTNDYATNYRLPITTSLTGGTILQNNQPLLHTYGTNNIWLGGAGNYTTTGSQNVGQGSGALGKLTTGIQNFAIGYESMFNATTASYNFAFGYRALYTCTTGFYNTAIGRYALRYTTSGRFNLGVGEQALLGNTTGYYNIGIGQSSLNANETGYGNIGFGYASGLYYKGTNSVFIGYWAGAHVVSGDSQLHIGISGNTLIEGNFATNYVQINNNLKVTNSVSASTMYIGDVANGNYMEINSKGHVILNGSATTFRDELGDVTSLKTVGVRITQNETENCITFATNCTTDDYVYANYQINHDWKLGSKVHPHLHGEQTENQNPNFLVQYRWQINSKGKTTAWTNYKVNQAAFTWTGGTVNQIWYDGGITPPVGAGLSDILQLRIIRDTANSSGLFAGTDTYTTSVNVTSIDIHIECDTYGSDSEYVK